MVKKGLALLMVVVIALTAVSCGGTKINGTYKGNAGDFEVSYTFNDGGAGKAVTTGLEDQAADFTYVVDGNNIKVSFKNDAGKASTITFALKDTTISDPAGNTFTKQ